MERESFLSQAYIGENKANGYYPRLARGINRYF
jgi:hypothetical protein